ncbi:RES domain-containing protein [Sphingomonas glacialis]|uniref:RES domain-containing protein n=2 Tax=Sphingomonas glacialis TaxID=658225 RepID=A0A502FRX5_9SPHN|nr:RES domain-containing protein [Sphingomonas glacialis]
MPVSGSSSRSRDPAKTKPARLPAPPAVAAPRLVAAPRVIPVPAANLADLVKTTSWPARVTMHRIHPDAYGAVEFNPGAGGNARFSPIADAKGDYIPTIYAGTTLECAAMETVFHDVPFEPGLKTVAKRKLQHHDYSQIESAAGLTLVDLNNTALRKLGIGRVDLIETDKDIYPQTRKWAEAIHAQCPDVQGLSWISRQDDRARAIMLFGDRMPPDPLLCVAPSQDIISDPATFSLLVDLADTIGVKITGR